MMSRYESLLTRCYAEIMASIGYLSLTDPTEAERIATRVRTDYKRLKEQEHE